MLAYVVLDGFDLGVGALLDSADSLEHKDMMIASIGPFWDANETWLVLGVGVLLVGFPMANGVILGALYLPVALMLVTLSLRGVAFDFRVKAKAQHRPLWDKVFYIGSILASWAQGWLIMKTEGSLQLKAVLWAKNSLWLTAAGVLAISIATPWLSQRIFDKWFSFPNLLMLLPIPVMTFSLFIVIGRSLSRLPTRFAQGNQYGAGVPFASTVGIFLLSFYGLAYSLFPWLVIDQLDIWQAASSPEALMVIFYGVVVVFPVIIGYTIFAYWVFWGKSTKLHY